MIEPLKTCLADRQSVYKLFVMCGDVAFVGLLPQLVLVLYFERANTYGCIASFATAIGLRILVRGCLTQLLHYLHKTSN